MKHWLQIMLHYVTRSDQKMLLKTSKVSGKKWLRREKRPNFLSINKRSITVIEKRKKCNWIRNSKIQHNDIPSDGKTDDERAKRIRFLSINKKKLTAIQIVRNYHMIQDNRIPHNFITSKRKNWMQASEASDILMNKQTLNCVYQK